ncbi:MAG TPA: metallophosphoesterase [Opitutaceae bacterium]|nr:metallophosphoesterase [Opitutaceae bacterium]
MTISRRNFIRTLAGAGVAGAGAKLWADTSLFPDTCVVRPFRVPAPAGWAGKTALFVTDLHYGHFFGPEESAALNERVRAENPDLVLMGGDLAHRPDMDIAGFLAHWKPGCPTIYAPGNHDMAGGLGGRIMDQARLGGLVVLENKAEDWNGLTLIGLPSALCAAQRISLLEGTGLKVVLGHEPDVWDQYAPSDLLHLAGHTHGGQICPFGRAWVLPTLGRKYVRGKFSRPGNRTLIVSSGIGCVATPVRLNCPPEIVRLEFT